MFENVLDFYNLLDNIGDQFGVKSCPNSLPKLGPKWTLKKVYLGGLPPAGKGPGRVLFLKMEMLGGGVGVYSDMQITNKGLIQYPVVF